MNRRGFLGAMAGVGAMAGRQAGACGGSGRTAEAAQQPLVRCVSTCSSVPVTEMWVTRDQLPYVPVQYVNEADHPGLRDMVRSPGAFTVAR